MQKFVEYIEFFRVASHLKTSKRSPFKFVLFLLQSVYTTLFILFLLHALCIYLYYMC